MTTQEAPVLFTPGLECADPLANYWMRQATLRLRRELCWLWRQSPDPSGPFPVAVDAVSESLDRGRFFAQKTEFWASDVAARYLTERLWEVEPPLTHALRGSFGWVIRDLDLDRAACLALALAALGSFDSGAGAVMAACQNDVHRTSPTLSLLQKLVDCPEDALSLADPEHALFSHGLLRRAERSGGIEWDAPLYVPELIARKLLYPEWPLPALLRTVPEVIPFPALHEAAQHTALRVQADPARLRVLSLLSGPGSAVRDLLGAIPRCTGRAILTADSAPTPQMLPVLLTYCWLQGCDLTFSTSGQGKLGESLATSYSVPVVLFIQTSERGKLEGVPPRIQLQSVEAPGFPFSERMQAWEGELAGRVSRDAIAQTARRFRYDSETIQDVAAGLRAAVQPITLRSLTAACRSARAADLGELAQRVEPRFDSASQLILPDRQRDHFAEVLIAMRALTEVHYQWGAARAWNEGGLPVLFAGPPGTGKTMAAEILASELDLPMYRIDLSQVVNKYIGETQKNLKRIFDAADVSDTLLLFDEADSIFGKRTESHDAHDRYANLEISYLLERMERFKGLAVLATNRKKDLDEAFLRRLRYIIDFPLPGPEQRLRIWEQALPRGVDSSELDLELLSSRFPIAGGHICSVIFSACLQSARGDERPKLTMAKVVVALKRELDKLNRPVALELFGEYAPLIERMEA